MRAGALVLVFLSVACGGGPHERDGSGDLDGGARIDGGGSSVDGGGATGTDGGGGADGSCGPGNHAGCPCARVGDIDCGHGGLVQLRCTADGWLRFYDGECGPSPAYDAGPMDAGPIDGSVAAPCEDPHEAGCPCSCEQERYCVGGAARLHCIDGVWRASYWECTPGPTCDAPGP